MDEIDNLIQHAQAITDPARLAEWLSHIPAETQTAILLRLIQLSQKQKERLSFLETMVQETTDETTLAWSTYVQEYLIPGTGQ